MTATAVLDKFGSDTSAPSDDVAPRLLRWTYGLVNRIVLFGDMAAILLGLMVGALMVPGAGEQGAGVPHLAQITLIAIIEIVAFAWALRKLKCYRVERYALQFVVMRDLSTGIAFAAMVGSTFLAAFMPSALASWNAVVVLHTPMLALLMADRVFARRLVLRLRRSGRLRRRTIILGMNENTDAFLRRALAPDTDTEYDVLHVFADAVNERRAAAHHGLPIAPYSRLADFARATSIDLVVVAVPLGRADFILRMFEELQWMPADIVIPVGQLAPRGSVPHVVDHGGQTVMRLIQAPLKGSQAIVKMLEDYVIASIALVLAAPLMGLIALAIKIDTPGPVLFRQIRTGFNSRPFEILKFRTMTSDPNDDGSIGTTSKYHPRITRVGRILRRLSVDELPQLLNVLRGDMSVVGPRPYVPNMLVENEQFHLLADNFAFRFRVKPGITGLAQAHGLRSNALRIRAKALRSVELDVQYVANWSIWLDLEIMIRTLFLSMHGPEVF